MKMLTVSILGLMMAVSPADADPLSKQSLDVGGISRSYLLYRPAGPRPAPLVIVLHGGGGNGENAASMTGFADLARREGFAVAFPNGSGRFGRALLTWNADHCCGYAMKNAAADVGFIRALIDAEVKAGKADPKRIYVTGMSNGAMMTERLGIALSDRIAAIAPVVGGLFGDEKMPAIPVSALIVNGGQDASVPPAGGRTGGRAADAWDGTPLKPSAWQGEFWAKANACAATPKETASGAVTRWTYDCPAGRDVVRVLVGDQGHAWPGGEKGSRRGDAPSRSYDATAEIWNFFKAHPKR